MTPEQLPDDGQGELLGVREACRRRHPLDGADAQALEGALSMTELERDKARADLKKFRDERWVEARIIAGIVAERDRLRDQLAEMARMYRTW